MARLPLEGVRIIDSTYVIAMPYAAGILADLGAEVIKVEGPTRIDTTRGGAQGVFTDNDPGDDWWNRATSYNLMHRGKRSLTLDLSKEEGREVFKELVKTSDVLMENFTPRVMRGWGLDYPNLKKIKPDIIMVSNTGYGHGGGPYSNYGAMATSMEGTHGLVSLTGYEGEELPSKAGQSFVDFVASWSALLGIGTALHYRNRTGKGQWQDLGMYQAGAFFAGEHILDWTANNRKPTRIGNRHPWRAPQGCYPCSGTDQWCVISVGDDDEWMALCKAIGVPELLDDTRFGTASDRMKHHDELDEIIRVWTSTLDKFEVMERLQGVGVPAGPVNDSKDANTDPHYWERGYMQRLDYPEERKMGSRVLLTRPWQLSKAPMPIERAAPKLGEGNEYFLQDLLGLSESEIAKLDEAGIICDQPPNPAPPNVISLPDQVKRGRVAYFDPDFKTKLGI